MSGHSLINCWIHLVWGTKERFPYFANPEMAKECKFIILDICKTNKYKLRELYINPEHVHALIKLDANDSLKQVVQKLKGISSNAINKRFFSGKFKWAEKYAAFSVSPNVADKVINYIKNQKEHHRVKSFAEEWELFFKEYEKEYGTH